MTTRALDRSDLNVRLLRLFASSTYRPPVLPAVALEIMELARVPNVTFEAVVAVLQRDPVMAAKVLSIAQSALYAPRSPILSLKQAAVWLGIKTLRDMVVEAALHLRVFRAAGYQAIMERLSHHSTLTAHLMHAVCNASGIDAEHSFLCGLLHDVGIAACLLALSDDARGVPVPFETLGPVLDEVHEEVSGMVLRLWGIPAEIQSIAASHHSLDVNGKADPIHAALIVAEQLAAELGAGMAAQGAAVSADLAELDANTPGLQAAACFALHLDEAAFATLRREAATIVMSLSGPPGGQATDLDS